ncbi:MAG: LapA family protein [Steroidobacteraceae bacterium]
MHCELMKKTALLALVLLGIAAFAAANWAAFTAPQLLTLGVVDFTAPLGLLMLLITAVVAVTFLTVLAVWQATTLAAFRRNSRELAAQKALAQESEVSRFTTLSAAVAQERQRIEARVEASEAALRTEINEGVNSIAAMLAELDNRLHGDPLAEETSIVARDVTGTRVRH